MVGFRDLEPEARVVGAEPAAAPPAEVRPVAVSTVPSALPSLVPAVPQTDEAPATSRESGRAPSADDEWKAVSGAPLSYLDDKDVEALLKPKAPRGFRTPSEPAAPAQVTSGKGAAAHDDTAEAVDGKKFMFHSALKGDTLRLLAARHGSSVDDLVMYNEIGPDDVLTEGQEVIVAMEDDAEDGSVSQPDTPVVRSSHLDGSERVDGSRVETHIAEAGDTIRLLAARHGASVSDLLRWNEEQGADKLLNIGTEYIVKITDTAPTERPVLTPKAQLTPVESALADGASVELQSMARRFTTGDTSSRRAVWTLEVMELSKSDRAVFEVLVKKLGAVHVQPDMGVAVTAAVSSSVPLPPPPPPPSLPPQPVALDHTDTGVVSGGKEYMFHRVLPRETLQSVSTSHGVPVERLLELNDHLASQPGFSPAQRLKPRADLVVGLRALDAPPASPTGGLLMDPTLTLRLAKAALSDADVVFWLAGAALTSWQRTCTFRDLPLDASRLSIEIAVHSHEWGVQALAALRARGFSMAAVRPKGAALSDALQYTFSLTLCKLAGLQRIGGHAPCSFSGTLQGAFFLGGGGG